MQYYFGLIIYACLFFFFYAAIFLVPVFMLAWFIPPAKFIVIVISCGAFVMAILRAHLASNLYSTGDVSFFGALGGSGAMLGAIIRKLAPWIWKENSSIRSEDARETSCFENIYLVQLSGWNFLMSFDGEPRKHTFHVNRYVRAPSGADAKKRAHSMLADEIHDVFEILNSDDDPGITNALHVSDPVQEGNPITELPKMEYRVTEDIGSAWPVLDGARKEELSSHVKLGKDIILDAIVWDFAWPKDELEPATRMALERARGHFFDALEMDGHSFAAKFYLAMISAEMNELEKACKWFVEASEILLNDPDCPMFAGIISGLLGEREKAVRYLKRAVQCHPLGASFWRLLALAYQEVGRMKDARRSIEHALFLDPKCIDCMKVQKLLAESQ